MTVSSPFLNPSNAELNPICHQLALLGKKVKQSHYRSGQETEGSRKLKFPDFVTTAQDGGKVVRLTHRPPLPRHY